MSCVSRREVVVGAAAAGTGALLADTEAGTRPPGRAPSRRVDVVVVGAGLAGLSAASNLVKAGHSVVVLESEVLNGYMDGAVSSGERAAIEAARAL